MVRDEKQEDAESANENYKPSLRGYDVIDKDSKEIIDSNLPKHVALKMAAKKKGWMIRATDQLAEETQIREAIRSIIKEELEEVVDSEKDERGGYFIKDRKRRNTTSALPGFHKPALGEEELEDEFYQKQQDLDNINVDQNQEKLAHKQAQESSTEGITQHVNYDGVGYFVSDESSEDTIATYENGENTTNSDRTIKSSDEFVKRFKDNISVAFGQSPRNESLNESKIRKVIKESIEKELAQINKEAEYEVLDSKLEKITDLIDRRKSRLAKLDEDEDIKALTDKKKVKQFEKEIKTLEKAKFKIEKVLAKKAKSAPKAKAIIDEDEPLDEAELNEAPPSEDTAQIKTDTEDILKNFQDMEKIELEEEEEEVVSGCCSAPISGEIDDEYGRCSDCGEMADVIKL